MNAYTHSISIWPLDEEREFTDSAPAWESAACGKEVAQAAHQTITHALAQAIVGYSPYYAVSLDKLDNDGIGVCQEMRTL